ncbi:MAG: helix-turn-helix domain-containing protein, partial [Bradyrhizobium sp.]|uniref:helix-turn-helix domain-containing protein n=1 Tax=Bradyrhizobium sp. TaxID=376 RepID=UPI001D6C09B3|nr:helix-turn-helix domain-containing protein [Bradyrhizobium sp.]
VSPEEASALTGIGLTSIREAISNGDLKAKKHGRRTIILPDDLKIWLNALPNVAGRETADAK